MHPDRLTDAPPRDDRIGSRREDYLFGGRLGEPGAEAAPGAAGGSLCGAGNETVCLNSRPGEGITIIEMRLGGRLVRVVKYPR